jgi:hypothetical protein
MLACSPLIAGAWLGPKTPLREHQQRRIQSGSLIRPASINVSALSSCANSLSSRFQRLLNDEKAQDAKSGQGQLREEYAAQAQVQGRPANQDR